VGDAVLGFRPGLRVEPAGVGAGSGLLDDVPGTDRGSGRCAQAREAVPVSGKEPPGPPPEGGGGLAGEVPDGLAQGPGLVLARMWPARVSSAAQGAAPGGGVS
jgi:hypothetical protein